VNALQLESNQMKNIVRVILLALTVSSAYACPKGYFPRNQSMAPGGGLSDVNCGGMDSTYGSGCGADNKYGGGGGLDDKYGSGGGLDDKYGGGGGLDDKYGGQGGLDNKYGGGGGLDDKYGGGGGLDDKYGGCGGLDTSPCGGMYSGKDLSKQYCGKIPPWPRYIQELVKRGKTQEAEKFVRALRATSAWK
jgi:hypothetical protein